MYQANKQTKPNLYFNDSSVTWNQCSYHICIYMFYNFRIVMNEEEIQFVFSPPTKLFENSESKTLERRLFQFIKEETPAATVPAQVVIKDGLNYGVMFDNIEQSLECPVCYKVPREVPVPCCVSGHIICKSCRSKMNECPTCRGWYYQNTSSIMVWRISFSTFQHLLSILL